MSINNNSNADTAITLPRHLVSSLLIALSSRIHSLDALRALLQPVLRCFGLLQQHTGEDDAWTGLTHQQKEYILRVSLLAEIQRILLQRVAVDWLHHLRHNRGNGDGDDHTILRPFFCPPATTSSSSSPYAQAIALSAYPVLMDTACSGSQGSNGSNARRTAGLVSSDMADGSRIEESLHPIARSTALEYLADLTVSHGLDTLFRHFFPAAETPFQPEKGRTSFSKSQNRALLDWQAFVALYISIPGRVANLPSSARRESIPLGLEWRAFLLNASRQAESLLSGIVEVQREDHTQALAHLLQKLARSGFVAPAPGQLSFWPAIWQPLRRSLLQRRPRSAKQTGSSWPATIGLLSSMDTTSVATAFFSHIQSLRLVAGSVDEAGPSPQQRIKQAAVLALRVFGSLACDKADSETDDLWVLVVRKGLLQRQGWDEGIARVLVAWAALSLTGAQDDLGDEKSTTLLSRLLEEVSLVWTDKTVIMRGGNAYHAYLSTVLVGTLAALPPLDPSILTLSRSPAFLSAISAHLSSLSAPIRLSGMYTAELVSERSTDSDSGLKPLSFGEVWADEDGRSVPDGGIEAVDKLRALARMEIGDWNVEDWLEPEEGEGVVIEEQAQAQAQVHAAATPSARGTTAARANGTARRAAAAAATHSKIQVISSDYDDYDRLDPASSTNTDDEDDLQPFALPPLPPAADLKDLDDPTIQTSLDAKNRIHPPVYLPDLLAYLRSGNDSTDKQAAEKVAMGLKEAEGLIRRKGSWGSELLDNAVELSFVLSGLQDNFSLPDFEEQRRDAMTALMVSCPARAAPAVIEQFFSQQYSVSQRFAMLSALAVGARELAGLPSLLPSPVRPDDGEHGHRQVAAVGTDFPTQRLPPKLHKYFMQAQSNDGDGARAEGPSTPQLDAMTEDITNLALSSTRQEAEQAVPGAKKEKLLTVRSTTSKRSRIVEQAGSSMKGNGNGTHSRSAPQFADLAVETFIMPLLNRFWLYLRDVGTSPQLATVGPYAGGRAGAAPLLDPLLLSKYLSTLCVLLDAARNSPHFLAVLAPETLELVLALRGGDIDPGPAVQGGANANAVQTALLQLSLVVLETSTSIDSGRTLARDFPKITWRVKDWAEEVWRGKESGGGEIDAGGRAAAGVLLRLDEVVSRTIGYH